MCFLLLSALLSRRWRLQLATGRGAMSGWRPWVSRCQGLVGSENRQCSEQSPGTLPGLGTLSIFCRRSAGWAATSQPLRGTRSHVRASLLCHTLNIVLFPQGGSIPSSQKSQPVAAWVAIVLKFKGTIGL